MMHNAGRAALFRGESPHPAPSPEVLLLAKEHFERAKAKLFFTGTDISLAVMCVIDGASEVEDEALKRHVSFRSMLRTASHVGRQLDRDHGLRCRPARKLGPRYADRPRAILGPSLAGGSMFTQRQR
jgi:hypothetical protein